MYNFNVIRYGSGLGDLIVALRSLELLKTKYYDSKIYVYSKYSNVLKDNPIIDKSLPLSRLEGKYIDLISGGKYADFSKNKAEIFCDRVNDYLISIGLEPIVYDKKPQTLWVSEENANKVEKYLSKFGEIFRIGVFHKSAMPYKTWNGIYNLIDLLSKNNNIKVFCFDDSVSIKNKRVINIVGNPIEEVIALVSRMNLIIAPDTAGLHIAGGLGISMIGLFGPTNPNKIVSQYRNANYIIGECPYKRQPCWFSENCFNKRTVCLDNIDYYSVYETVQQKYINV
jgi:ADP-heptose:LPS heptosyltransferase